MPGANGLSTIQHIVVLMLENRSFDHAYYMPGADPGEGYMATNDQLFGSESAPSSSSVTPSNDGFIKDFTYTLGWQSREGGWSIVAGTTGQDIMGCFAPQTLPVLSGLARGYAVCDQWFSSVPTETLPNRAFACAGTSQGHMDDKTHTFTSPSIFGLLDSHGQSWGIYGYDAPPLTKDTFTDISGAAASHFGVFTDFTAAASAGTLPAFTFLEPSWSSTGNSQHPNYNVASSSSTTCTRRSGAVPDGPRRCWSSRTTSTAAAMTTWRRRLARFRRTTTRASSVSTSPGSGCGSRRSWSRR
jgi:phospholipase C